MIPSPHRSILPDGWEQPREYAHGIAASGTMLFVAGQIGASGRKAFETDDMGEQAMVALANLVAVLRAGGAEPAHLVRLTWYVTSIEEYRSAAREIGSAYARTIGGHRPVMTLIEVGALVSPHAKIEIEGTAVVPVK